MESPVVSPVSGIVRKILVAPGSALSPGQILMGVEP